MNTIHSDFKQHSAKMTKQDLTRLNKMDKITERWEQQDTHTTKRRLTHDINHLQQTKQQQQHHRTILTDKQLQTTSYDQWIQQKEQRKQQTRRQQIRLWDGTYYQTMETENNVNHTKQQKLPTKSAWKSNTGIATGNITLNTSNPSTNLKLL